MTCRSAAARELERADARLPWPRVGRRPVDLVVLVHVVEGAVVAGVDAHRRVVAPARVGSGLHAVPVLEDGLALTQLAERVAGQTPGVTDARFDVGSVDDAVARGEIAELVLRDAAHPTVDTVAWSVRALLVDDRVLRVPYLVPADSGDARRRLDGLIRDQRLVRLEVPILEPERR